MSILLDDKWFTARKQHSCDVCFEPITVGERYRRQRVIYEGDPGVFKVHALCDEAYWIAYRELGLMGDETPDFQEDIQPILERLRAAGREMTDD